MTYPGGKGNLYQKIINLIPPHRVYIEAFAGGAAVALNKRPAQHNILLDLDPAVIEAAAAAIAEKGDKIQPRPPETPDAASTIAANGADRRRASSEIAMAPDASPPETIPPVGSPSLTRQVPLAAPDDGRGHRREKRETPAIIAQTGEAAAETPVPIDQPGEAPATTPPGQSHRVTWPDHSRDRPGEAGAMIPPGQSHRVTWSDHSRDRPVSHSDDSPWWTFLCGEAIAFLTAYAFQGDEFVYCDPPYLMATRRRQRQIYRYEMTRAQHIALLNCLLTLPCRVMISGYRSDLYESMLAGWNVERFETRTRGNSPAIEYLWMNYPRPTALHDYTHLGDDFRERERIKRKKARWVQRWLSMSLLERQAILAAIAEADAGDQPRQI